MPGSTNTPFFFTSAIAVVDSLSSIARATLLLTSQLSASPRTSCVWVILTFAIFLLIILIAALRATFFHRTISASELERAHALNVINHK